ncbi:MAG: hypothetical protein JW940_00165 [Polyangiaceae bacterium]|nr:hypothetical protein [Polyangiaceae bacterium]
MIRFVGALAATAAVLIASDASAVHATACRGAIVDWVSTDGHEFSSSWYKETSSASCGTYCRLYNLPVLVADPSQDYRITSIMAMIWKNGTDGNSHYYQRDWDFKSSTGLWVEEDGSAWEPHPSNGRVYYGWKDYVWSLGTESSYEVRFDYQYVSGEPWFQRRFNFLWTWIV